jgi:hypothetical protein
LPLPLHLISSPPLSFHNLPSFSFQIRSSLSFPLLAAVPAAPGVLLIPFISRLRQHSIPPPLAALHSLCAFCAQCFLAASGSTPVHVSCSAAVVLSTSYLGGRVRTRTATCNTDLRLATWIQNVNSKPSSSCKSHILKSLTRGGGHPPSPPV